MAKLPITTKRDNLPGSSYDTGSSVGALGCRSDEATVDDEDAIDRGPPGPGTHSTPYSPGPRPGQPSSSSGAGPSVAHLGDAAEPDTDEIGSRPAAHLGEAAGPGAHEISSRPAAHSGVAAGSW